MSVPYHPRQITEWLDSYTVSKARSYASAVSELRWIDGDTLAGLVQGTRTRPYDVRAYFHDIDEEMWVEGECTCPVGVDCKHVAALLIAGLALQPKPSATGVRAELVTWLEDFRARRTAAAPTAKKKSAKATHALAYVIEQSYRGAEVILYKARVSADGTIRSLDDPWQNVEKALIEPPKFVTEEDLPILRGLWLGRSPGAYTSGFRLEGTTGAATLEKLIATGRLFAASAGMTMDSPCLVHSGPARSAQITWQAQADSRVRPVLQAEPPATLLLTTTRPCWYVDAHSGESGLLTFPWPAEQVADFLSMPAITLGEAALVGNVLREIAPDLPAPPASDASSIEVIDTVPIPVLALDTRPVWGSGWSPSASQSGLDFATVSFDYAGHNLPANSNTTLVRTAGGEVIQIRRSTELERNRLTELQKTGFRKIAAQRAQGPKTFHLACWGPTMTAAGQTS